MKRQAALSDKAIDVLAYIGRTNRAPQQADGSSPIKTLKSLRAKGLVDFHELGLCLTEAGRAALAA